MDTTLREISNIPNWRGSKILWKQRPSGSNLDRPSAYFKITTTYVPSTAREAEVLRAPILLGNIQGDGIRLRFKKPIRLCPTLENGALFVELPEAELYETGKTREELIGNIQENFTVMWKEYACEDDSKLDLGARDLKRWLLQALEVW